jgi:tRNA (guanine37-N1)-methyltransferase
MIFHIITLFPKSFESYFKTSILKIAQNKKIFKPIFYNLANFSVKNTKRVDDRPYAWLPWTILSPEPIYNLINSIEKKYWKLKIIYMSARWKILTQQKLEKFAKNQKDLIVICGHYEWIDQRIIDIFNIEEISIGKYILTSWELATMTFIDWIVRLLPGVINEKSLEEESFSKKLKRKIEYSQYTRPENFMWYKVPSELLSWNPKIIENWKNKFLK